MGQELPDSKYFVGTCCMRPRDQETGCCHVSPPQRPSQPLLSQACSQTLETQALERENPGDLMWDSSTFPPGSAAEGGFAGEFSLHVQHRFSCSHGRPKRKSLLAPAGKNCGPTGRLQPNNARRVILGDERGDFINFPGFAALFMTLRCCFAPGCCHLLRVPALLG